MKQSLDEAAYNYAADKTEFRKYVLKEVNADNYASRHSDCMKDFIRGAEWQQKQSPWVSVKERLPKEDELVLCRMVSNGAVVSGYVFVSTDNYACVSTSPDFEFEDYGGYVCDMWMPMPKFNE